VHIGEITDPSDFRPWIRIWAPNGSTLGSESGLAAAQRGDVIAPVTGTYRILVSTFDSGYDGSGTYRITMTKTPGPITVSEEDQGGPLTNGGIHTGELLTGDLDVWTFNATVGQRIAVHIGEITDPSDFRPWIRIWAPNGSTLGSESGLAAAQRGDVIAPVSGTYLVLVGSFDSGYDGFGTYRLSLVKTTGPITVSANDQGGPITNGGIHTGEILQGDVDTWTFDANAGDRIAVHVGEITDPDDFRPWIRLWTPAGGTLGSESGLGAAQIGDVIAPVTGRYIVVVSTFDSGYDGTGTYRLNTVRTPGPVIVSGGDQGGTLTNGGIQTGEIVRGDIDIWTFSATSGERLAVHIGEITDTADFRPWIRVWAPNGATLGSEAGLDAARIGDVIAPVSGLYLVIVGTFDSGYDGTGTYRLSIARTQGEITVSGGDQGGPLPNAVSRPGQIVQGDLDLWSFTATAGQNITIQISETGETDDFRPWIRLWSPNGGTLGSASGLAGAQIGPVVAPITGRYLVLAGSFDSGYDGTGTYQLTATVTNP
jgi:regulator of RNase E activity RraB